VCREAREAVEGVAPYECPYRSTSLTQSDGRLALRAVSIVVMTAAEHALCFVFHRRGPISNSTSQWWDNDAVIPLGCALKSTHANVVADELFRFYRPSYPA
jgi:hypothetical protein